MKNDPQIDSLEILLPKALAPSAESKLNSTTGLQVQKLPKSRDTPIWVEILAVTAHSLVIIAEILKLKAHFSQKPAELEKITLRNVNANELKLKDANEQNLKELIAGNEK